MFTVEIRVNGSLVACATGQNTGWATEEGEGVYDYEYYQPSLEKKVKSKIKRGQVYHNKSDGIRKLVSAVLKDVDV